MITKFVCYFMFCYREDVKLERLRIDIQDLDLLKVPSFSERFVAVGKHICGAATGMIWWQSIEGVTTRRRTTRRKLKKDTFNYN